MIRRYLGEEEPGVVALAFYVFLGAVLLSALASWTARAPEAGPEPEPGASSLDERRRRALGLDDETRIERAVERGVRRALDERESLIPEPAEMPWR